MLRICSSQMNRLIFGRYFCCSNKKNKKCMIHILLYNLLSKIHKIVLYYIMDAPKCETTYISPIFRSLQYKVPCMDFLKYILSII